jgi:ATP-dependent DNA helicase RecQ
MMNRAIEILKSVFGYSTFRPQQEAIIANILSGKDSIVLMPTGGGKSLCFQVPALLFGKGTTLVISPLISLMKDQVEALKSNGVEAAFFNSSQSEFERREILLKAQNSELKLLYMAPETIMNAMNGWLRSVSINLVAIDEAHCVSMWGHDFRPEYTQLHLLRDIWDNVPFIALTATADKATRKEIETKLGLIQPQTFLTSFDRPNLSLNVRGNLKKSRKQEEVLNFIFNRRGQSGIIYCLSRRETEEWSEFLNKNGIQAAHYHAGLEAEERNRIQEDFINDNIPVITATIAFGMGIDKSNVRWIIHNNLPKNIEGYYQEIGRAGRDGLPSETRLYYNMKDVKLLADFAQDSPHKDVLIEKLNRMLQYAETQTCRRKTLLSYFSEMLENNCGNCDVCNNPPEFIDGTIIAQKALSGIWRTNEKVGINLLIQLLRGAQTHEIMENNFHLLKTYGVGKEHGFEAWRHYITQMLNLGLIEIAYDENLNLRITEFGEKVLFSKIKIDLTHYQAATVKAKGERDTRRAEPKDDETSLFERLRKLRREIAMEENVPAYIVFSDATLKDMVEKRPQNKLQMLDVSGVGQQKLENYGDLFLEAIRKHEKGKISTYEITFEMYQKGMIPVAIALERNLHENTIFSHLAKLFLDGKDIDLYQFITQTEIEQIAHAVNEIGATDQLKPIFEFLNEEIPYHKIRIALAILEKGVRLKM